MGGFEDLVPPEIAGSRRSGVAPMRPAPPAPPGIAAAQASRPSLAAPPSSSSPATQSLLSGAMAPQPPGATEETATVDGVPDAVVDCWFQLADADADGRVADAEARDFFLTSGLAAADLSKIWKLVKSPDVIAREGKGLSRHRFAQVLRLIALAQSGEYEFSQQNASAALLTSTWLELHGAPLPPPHIAHPQAQQAAAACMERGALQPALVTPAAWASEQQPQQWRGDGSDTSSASASSPPSGAFSAAAAAPAAAAPAAADLGALCFDGPDLTLGGGGAAMPPHSQPFPQHDDDDDLFGLRALRQRAVSHGAAESSEAAEAETGDAAPRGDGEGGEGPQPPSEPAGVGMVRRMSRSVRVSEQHRIQRTHTGACCELEAPVAFEARLPPLQPKVSAKLTLLAAANGSLFAGPAVGGGVLQWGRPEGNMRRPLDASEQQVTTEDQDAAPAIEVQTCGKGRAASCLYVDQASQLLWVADKEGWVYAYDTSGEPCMSLKAGHRAYHFQAHRVGFVTAMRRTSHGHLWTGSSRGNLRVWELKEPALLGDAPEPPRARELRKGFGERAHSGPVLALSCPADGQLVWSASSKGVLLWDAACGAFLGLLQRTSPRPAPAAQPELSASPTLDVAALRYKVDGAKGLETDPITGYVVSRPPSFEWERIAVEQEAWAAQTDNNINELMERVSIGGSKALQGAGKAVKLLGKLARGLGGSSAPTDIPKPTPNRALSSSSLGGGSGLAGSMPDEDLACPPAAASVGDIVAVVTPPSGGVWVAHKGGMMDRYSAAGQRQGSDDCGPSITAVACVGQRVWVGFADGMISVRDSRGATLRVFQAHAVGVLAITQAGTRTFTLAADGSIKGWSSAMPCTADAEALASWDEQACTTFQRQSLRVLCVTWNVGESKPDPGSAFFRWVHEAAFNTQLVVLGLQEIEMGSSSVALAAAKDAFSHKMQERGNTNAKFWGAGVLQALGGDRHWHQVGLRQLSGMLVLVFARNNLRSSIGEVTTSSVACGVLGVGGNKGAVAVEFSVHRRRVAVVCSHFAAHQGAVEARNANYATICRQLTFSRRAWYAEEGDAPPPLLSGPGAASSNKTREKQAGFLAGSAADDLADLDSDADSAAGGYCLDPSMAGSPAGTPGLAGVEDVVQGEGMREAEMLVWLGDFNYRIDGGYEAVKERAIRNELPPLLELDQCRREMAAGRVFRGLREGQIGFRPTYKFDRASANPFAYDTSEKRRIPAWCDRVFFRGSKAFPGPEWEDVERWDPPSWQDEVGVRALEYSCWADVTDSDHKPVYAVLEVNLPITDQAKKRAVCSQLLKECAAAALRGATARPACTLAPEYVKLHPTAMPRQVVLLRNEGPLPLLYAVCRQADPSLAAVGRHGSDEEAAAVAAAHQLVEVRPVRGVVAPGSDQQLWIHLAGDEGALQAAEMPPEVRYRVVVGSEFSCGGESTAPGSSRLSFTATCLTHL
ncbi:Type II inositol polyphosphate 5-phosphatase 15 [Chlorella vulgaris]